MRSPWLYIVVAWSWLLLEIFLVRHNKNALFKPTYLLIFVHFPFVFYKSIKVLITSFNVGLFPTPPSNLSTGCLTIQLSSDILCLEMVSEPYRLRAQSYKTARLLPTKCYYLCFWPTKARLVKAMVFPVVMYGCEGWTTKKAEHCRLMLLKCGIGEDSWESFGLQGDPTSPS